MAAETPSDYKIELLGISWASSSFNPLMTDGRDLPWLQDTTGGEVTTNWKAGYRDFVIIDPANERSVDAYNLTENPLSDPANREELKAILLGLAELRDTDGDKLSDFWEDEMFDGDLSSGPDDNRDQDNSTELLEYALGSHADDPASMPRLVTGSLLIGGDEFPTITFRRRLGASGGLVYAVELSTDLGVWSSAPADLIELIRINPYDGTGTEIVTYRTVRSMDALPQGRGCL